MTLSEPVDLLRLRAACGPVIACYERFLLHGHLDVHELDDALAPLRRLPRIPGRLGRAIALVASGGGAFSTADTIEALELLRTTAGLRTPPPAPPPSGAGPQRHRRHRHPPPPRLPGFG